MTPSLDDLITGAIQLAGDEGTVASRGRLWHFEGGRPCPIGWGGCSQSVYVDIATGEYDFGEPGGPGHNDCLRHCRNGMEPPPIEDEDEAAPFSMDAGAPEVDVTQ